MSQQHTKIDFLSVVYTLPLLSEIAKNCAQLQYAAENPAHEIAFFLHDAHVQLYRKIAPLLERSRDLKSLRRRAEIAEKIFSDSVGHNHPLQWSPVSAEAAEFAGRGSLQQQFTQKTLDMIAPLLGGSETIDAIFLDCIIVSLSKIFGKRWEIVKKSGKKFFYENWGELLLDGMPAGLVCWGFKNLSCMISLSGSGCTSTDMRRVHRLLTHKDMSIFRPKISRVDIALNDLAGDKINYQKMRGMTLAGLFNPARGAAPRYSCIESGHVVVGKFNKKKRILETHEKLDFFPDLGCSLYIGSRDSGKMCRGYEKGIQLQCAEHPRWFRVEYELRSVDRVLPPEILLQCDEFFCGCSAAAAKIFNDVTETQVEPVHILTFRAQIHAGVEHVKKFAALQCARAVVWMREVEEMSDSQIVDFLIERLDGRREKDRIPKRLAVPVPYAALPHRGDFDDFSDHRPAAGDAKPVLIETQNINDFYATVAA